MKIRLVLALGALSFLGACTDADWSRNMSFIGLEDSAGAQPVAETAPQPAPQPAAQPRPMVQTAQTAAPTQSAPAAGVNPFCAAVARQDADGHGFDAPTQQGIFVRSYQQCVAVFGDQAGQ